MPPIGETLREARLRQEIDIADVEQATKIRAKYLRALESEEFDRLPGSTFVRTFLRTYADYLGLDSQLLVEEYRSRHETPREDEVQPFAAPPPPRREARRRVQPPAGGRRRGLAIVGAVVGVLAVLVVIGLLAGGDDDADQAREGAPTADARERRAVEPGAREVGRAGQRERVTLSVTPLAETYVCVDNGDGERLFEGIITDEQTFRDEALRVNLGNTQVQMELNGEELPVEQGSNPVGFEFTPEGQEELPEGERPCT